MNSNHLKQEKNLEALRHSTAHLLASAIKEIYPDAKLGIGPAIENGFYYDFDFGEQKISEEDLPKIEAKMHEIQGRGEEFKKSEVSYDQASELFRDEPYKLELIEAIKQGEITDPSRDDSTKPDASDSEQSNTGVSIYQHGEFVDLCRGPHVSSTAEIGPFKLLSIAGAYWRGSEENLMLTRIYGTVFPTQSELDKHLKLLEEAEKRNHRKIGRELDLFFIDETVGQGLPLFTEKGAAIRRELENWVIEEEVKRGYKHVITPDLARTKLYEISGHYPYYADTMYPVMQVDDTQLVLRPMTCPHHFMLFEHQLRSYQDLPLKIAELAKLYRYEKSGELSGLQRVRGFCLADSHIFCREKQAKQVVIEVIELIEHMATTLGLTRGQDFWYRLSLGNPDNKEKYYEDPEGWKTGERLLKQVVDQLDSPYYEALDEAAFYGPKLDVQMRNVYGKEDTAFTVQYDFCLPARFNLKYVNEKGEQEQPVVIHRSSIGAIERTMAFLIEYYAGAFPVWLHPVQAIVLPISQDQNEYAKQILGQIKSQIPNVRMKTDDSNETLQKKIRNAQLEKTPYMLIVGKKEEKNQTVNVRLRNEQELGEISIDDFTSKFEEKIKTKAIE